MLSALDVLVGAAANRPSNEAKLRALRIVDEELGASLWRATPDFPNLLSYALVALLQTLNDEDMNIWSLAKEVLNKHIKALLKTFHERIIFELFRGIRHGVAQAHPASAARVNAAAEDALAGTSATTAAPAAVLGGRAQRIALELFAAVCHRIKPHKARKFMLAVVAVIEGILRPFDGAAQEEDVLLLEALGTHFDPIARHLVPFLSDTEVKQLLTLLLARLSLSQAASRRAMATAIAAVARHYPLRSAVLAFVLEQLRSAVVARDDENALQGALQCHALLTRVAAEIRAENRYAADPMLPELRASLALCRRCLTAQAHSTNVLVTALEWLHELLALYASDLFRDVLVDAPAQCAFLCELRALLDDASLRVSVRSLVLACLAQLLMASHMRVPVWSLLSDAWPDDPPTRVRSVLQDADPTLRGHAASFLAAWIQSYCAAPLELAAAPPATVTEGAGTEEAVTLAQAGDAASAGDTWLPALLETLLALVADDRSSIAAKMAVTGLIACWEVLAASRWALWALWVLVRLLDALQPRAFRLVKTELIAFVASRDWSLVHFLVTAVHAAPVPHGSALCDCPALRELPRAALVSLQARALDALWTLLSDADQQVRAAAADAIAASLSRVHHASTSALRLQARASAGVAPWFTAPLPLSVEMAQLRHIRFSMTHDERDESSVHDESESESDGADTTVSVQRLAFERAYVPVSARDDPALQALIERVARELERASMADDASATPMLRALYRLLRRVAARSNVLPLHQLVPTLLDQLEALPAALDVHVHLDLLQLLRTLLPRLSGDLARHARRVWLHLVRVVHIIAAVVRHQPRPALLDTPPPAPSARDAYEPTLPAIQARAQYLRLWERLSDSYRIGRTAFTLHEENVFDALLAESFRCLAQCVQHAHTLGSAYVAQWTLELISYARACFEEQPLAVLRLVSALFTLTFTPPQHTHTALASDLVHYAETRADVSPVLAPCTDVVTARPSLLTAPSAWADVLRELASCASPTEMAAALATAQRRSVLKELEPLVAAAMQRYLASHDAHLQQGILRVLALLVRHEVEFAALDKDQTFFRHVLTQVQGQRGAAYALAPLAFLARLHLERRLLHAVLPPRAFAPLMVHALRGWSRFATNTEFAVSLYALLHVLWSAPVPASAAEEERELRAQMRRDVVQQLVHRLPHPLATQALLFVLELAHGAHAALWNPPAPTQSEIGGATLRAVSDGVVALLRPGASAWKLAALRERDLVALCLLADRVAAQRVALDTVLALAELPTPEPAAQSTSEGSVASTSASVLVAEQVARARGMHEVARAVLVLRLVRGALEHDAVHAQRDGAADAARVCAYVTGIFAHVASHDVAAWSHVALLFDSLALLTVSPAWTQALHTMLDAHAATWLRTLLTPSLSAFSAPAFALVRLLRTAAAHSALLSVFSALLVAPVHATWHGHRVLGAALSALAHAAALPASPVLTPLLAELESAIASPVTAPVVCSALVSLAVPDIAVRALLVVLVQRVSSVAAQLRAHALTLLARPPVDDTVLSAAVLVLAACAPVPDADAVEWQLHLDALLAAQRACEATAVSSAVRRVLHDALVTARAHCAAPSEAHASGVALVPLACPDVAAVQLVLARASPSAAARVRALVRDVVARGSVHEGEVTLWRAWQRVAVLEPGHWRTVLAALPVRAAIVQDALQLVQVGCTSPLEHWDERLPLLLTLLAALYPRAECVAQLPALPVLVRVVAVAARLLAVRARVARSEVRLVLDAAYALGLATVSALADLSAETREELCAALLALHAARFGHTFAASPTGPDASAALCALLRAWPLHAEGELRQWQVTLRCVADAFELQLIHVPEEPLNLDYHDDPYALIAEYLAVIAAPLDTRHKLVHPTRRALPVLATRLWGPLLGVVRAEQREDANEDVAVPPALRVLALHVLVALLHALHALDVGELAALLPVDDLAALLEQHLSAYARKLHPSQLALQHATLHALARLLTLPALLSDARVLSCAAHVHALVATLPELGEDPVLRPALLDVLSALTRFAHTPPNVSALAKLLPPALNPELEELLHESAALRALRCLAELPRERADLVRAWPTLAAAVRARLGDGPRAPSSSQALAELTARWLAIVAEVAPSTAQASAAASPPAIAVASAAAGATGAASSASANSGTEGDRVLERIEAVKRLAERLRSEGGARVLRQLVRHLSAFGEEERIALLFGELTRAAPQSQRFVLALAQCDIGAPIIADWLRMSLEHLVHLGALVAPQTALRTLAALFALVAEHELSGPLVALLTSDDDLDEAELARLFLFAAQLYVREDRKASLVAALKRASSEPYTTLRNSLSEELNDAS